MENSNNPVRLSALQMQRYSEAVLPIKPNERFDAESTGTVFCAGSFYFTVKSFVQKHLKCTGLKDAKFL